MSAEFVELTDENFTAVLESTALGLVDYYAGWCGACRMAAPMFKRVAGELGLALFKIDAEKNLNARGAVTIENLPTLALVINGQIVGSLCTTKEEGLRAFLSEHGVKGA